jgi:2-C-methyl-D-erythritol 4-phosphate cytidylyltransferase
VPSSRVGHTDPVSVWGIVLAAGAGTRFGDTKQFATLGGRRLVDRVVETAGSVCDDVVVVLPEEAEWRGPRVTAAVAGGSTRAESVRRGLRAVPPEAEIIVVHDAAHPLASRALFEAVVGALTEGVDCVLPCLPLTEPIKRVQDGRVVATLPRDDWIVVQSPHVFRARVLRAAHRGAPEAVEDTVLVEELGGTIAAVPGEPTNLHVTTPAELELAARLVEKT